MRARPAKLGTEDYARLAAFRYALRRFLRFSEQAARRAGLTPQHYQALLALRGAADAPRMTINDLAKRLLIRHNSAVGLVDRLVRQALLVRRPSAEDARKVHLELTAKGLRVVEKVAERHRAELGQAGPAIAAALMQIAQAQELSRPRRAPPRPRRKAG